MAKRVARVKAAKDPRFAATNLTTVMMRDWGVSLGKAKSLPVGIKTERARSK
jgi:hypothetical protein